MGTVIARPGRCLGEGALHTLQDGVDSLYRLSTGYILLVLFLCELARKLIAPLNPGLVKTALNEAIASADLCGCCFELIIIADNYGIGAYFIYMFLLTIWWGQHWGDATACPYNHFEECVQGKMTKQETAVRTVAQTIGGVLVFRLIQVLWALEIAETHVGRSHSAVYNVCSADLTIPVLHGAIMEGICTLGCRLGSRLITMRSPSTRRPWTASSLQPSSCSHSTPQGDISTQSSPPLLSLAAGATLPWSTSLYTGSDPPWALSPPSLSGLIWRRRWWFKQD